MSIRQLFQSFFQSFAIALDMLRLHKMRAFLTMLGVIIGVMSVTIIVLISSGFQYYMTNEFKRLGADTIFVFYDPGRQMRGEQRFSGITGLTNDDVDFIMRQVPQLEIAAPIMQVPAQPVYAGENEVNNPRIFGSNQYFSDLNRLALLEGRTLNETDINTRANVAVIGEELRDRLFPDKVGLGKFISLKGITLEVVGVFERIDIMGETNARDILLPVTTVQDKWIGGRNIMFITTRPKPGVTVNAAMDAIWQVLMIKSNNRTTYRVDSRESIMNVFGSVIQVAGIVLAGIAALSLLVGGIGIMNIMLVSVTERTREIGLRKAVGAKRPMILTQFLVEAATLSLVGGLIGMGLAYMIGQGLSMASASFNWPSKGGLPATFPVTAALASAAFSALIGMVFGFYPALSASKLDPIVALRHE